MIAGQGMARLASCIDRFHDEQDKTHNEQKLSVQRSFIYKVTSLVQVIDKLGNPFRENDKKLLVLDTSDIAPAVFVDTIRPLSYRQDLYKKFID